MKRYFLSISYIAYLVILAGAAQASIIQVDLTASSQSGNPGDTLAFFATITNLSTTDTIYFNGASATAASSSLSIDISPYLIFAPISLAPEQTSSPFEFVDVTIDPAAAPGAYNGSIVSVLGGADGGTSTLFDDLADPSFDVFVNDTTTAAPEPATGWLISGAICLMAAGIDRRRRQDPVRRDPRGSS